MRTDYYELLGVEASASEAELKKGFRKKAIRLHPDKNPSEDAAALFNEVRVAYETLIDPQERAWYDSHKYQVLAEMDDIGGGEDGEEDNAVYYSGTTVEDVQRYFNNDLYSRMDDSVQGFYQVVNVLITTIASEEVSAGKQQRLPGFDSFKDDTSFANACDGQELMYPRFGNSKSDYGSDVRLFYNAWSNFQSVKTFAWFDEYRYSSAPDRRTRRMMERENRKRRQQARKDFNETVRKWIAFIKHKDPRVSPVAQKKYEQERIRKQQRDLKRQAMRQKKERAAADSRYVEQDWQAIDAEELAEIEQQLDKIYNEEEKLNGEDTDDEDENDDLYECVVCDKTFKSEEQMKDHERSKKHIKRLRKLKWKMRKEGLELGIDEEGFVEGNDSDDEFDDALEEIEEEEEEKDEQAESKEEMQETEEEEEEEEEVEHDQAESKEDIQETVHEVFDEPQTSSLDSESNAADDVEIDDSTEELDDTVYGRPEKNPPKSAENKPKGQKTVGDKKLEELSAILNGVTLDSGNDEDDDWSTGNRKKAKKKGRKKGNKSSSASPAPSSASSVNRFESADGGEEMCAVCGESFSSRNKLFQHVASTGHAAPPSRVKRGKRRNRR
ncbi:DEKNAAC102170 [Brettanomyces naardenensis]|uniref:DEKNAAC102170 n=1 Tax=Brettanomyces naardenensis TaxID=13370 RepID=A0A448YK84_BRENA|nr:DEKNAAC102170 [Brettanomyces naardenensis]